MSDDQAEADRVEEQTTPRAPVIYETVRRGGEEEMARPATSLWWSGLAAGLSLSFSVLAQAVLRMHLPDAPWRELVTALGYPVGFLMVVLARQQLFTENTLTVVLPVMAEPSRDKVGRAARLWAIVLAANMAGTFVAALFCTYTPVIDDELREAMLAISRHAMAHDALSMGLRGITAGFLMASMVWLLPGASNAQFPVVFIITYLIGIAGSAHIVAGSAEAFLLLLNGEMGLGRLVGGFALPALAGNIFGGTVLFAMIAHAQVMQEIEPAGRRPTARLNRAPRAPRPARRPPPAMTARPAPSPAPPVSADVGVLRAGWSYASISDKIADDVLKRPLGRGWLAAFLLTLAGMLAFLGAIAYLFVTGVGLWGVNVPVAWGFAIANCVWWIGIGHAGTFISAVLLLLRQKWRTSINRFAEAMTLFAAGMAGLFPLLHLGRPWFFYWIAPYPDKMNLWPQWRSPLVWDFFAIATYVIVSFLFWYLGLIPDLATLRDRARSRFKRVAYGLLALGWRGESRHWARQQSAYLLLAGLATPLVVSVHSVVSLDFAIGNTPGWHSTIFPPYFVSGALFSGFAMVLTLAIPLRRAFGLHDFITEVHLDHAAKVLLATGSLLAYGYLSEVFFAFFSGDRYEIDMTVDRWTGAYAPVYWGMLACNVLAPQVLWWRRARRSAALLFGLSLVINVGMWMERVLIVVQSLHRDFLPSSWGLFVPTVWDWVFLLGSISTFAWLFLVFIRLLPAISISEMRELVRESAK